MSTWTPHRIKVLLANADGARKNRTLTFFATYKGFGSHARKHLTCHAEPWDSIFGRELVENLRKACQESDPKSVTYMKSTLYREIVNGLEEVVRWSATKPVYIVARQAVKKNRRFCRDTTAFLGVTGCVLFAWGENICSAYFPKEACRYRSPRRRFEASWRYLRIKYGRNRIRSETDGDVRNMRVHRESKENWKALPQLTEHQRLPGSTTPKRSPSGEKKAPRESESYSTGSKRDAHAEKYRTLLEDIKRRMEEHDDR